MKHVVRIDTNKKDGDGLTLFDTHIFAAKSKAVDFLSGRGLHLGQTLYVLDEPMTPVFKGEELRGYYEKS